jgi:hypothetical protein
MIKRIPQRTKTDCAICAVAMVMGHPFSYERVLQDSSKYPKISSDGKFWAWWETYLRDEGFDACYCRFNGLYALPDYGGSAVGLLGMDIPHLSAGHVVTVDEAGVVDPADNAPDHIPLQQYVLSRLGDGVVFHDVWLAVRKPIRMPPARQNIVRS